MDAMTTEQRSELMSKIRGKDTKPELLVRKRLFAAGWRFRVCDKRLKGKPDIVIPKAKTIIDVRGCFWHRHGCKDSTMPKSNIAFWMEKWAKNVKRDHRNEKAWSEAGWNLIIVWQCALDGVKAGHTLERICSKIELWAAECEIGKPRRIPHRMELPKTIRKAKVGGV